MEAKTQVTWGRIGACWVHELRHGESGFPLPHNRETEIRAERGRHESGGVLASLFILVEGGQIREGDAGVAIRVCAQCFLFLFLSGGRVLAGTYRGEQAEDK